MVRTKNYSDVEFEFIIQGEFTIKNSTADNKGDDKIIVIDTHGEILAYQNWALKTTSLNKEPRKVFTLTVSEFLKSINRKMFGYEDIDYKPTVVMTNENNNHCIFTLSNLKQTSNDIIIADLHENMKLQVDSTPEDQPIKGRLNLSTLPYNIIDTFGNYKSENIPFGKNEENCVNVKNNKHRNKHTYKDPMFSYLIKDKATITRVNNQTHLKIRNPGQIFQYQQWSINTPSLNNKQRESKCISLATIVDNYNNYKNKKYHPDFNPTVVLYINNKPFFAVLDLEKTLKSIKLSNPADNTLFSSESFLNQISNDISEITVVLDASKTAISDVNGDALPIIPLYDTETDFFMNIDDPTSMTEVTVEQIMSGQNILDQNASNDSGTSWAQAINGILQKNINPNGTTNGAGYETFFGVVINHDEVLTLGSGDDQILNLLHTPFFINEGKIIVDKLWYTANYSPDEFPSFSSSILTGEEGNETFPSPDQTQSSLLSNPEGYDDAERKFTNSRSALDIAVLTERFSVIYLGSHTVFINNGEISFELNSVSLDDNNPFNQSSKGNFYTIQLATEDYGFGQVTGDMANNYPTMSGSNGIDAWQANENQQQSYLRYPCGLISRDKNDECMSAKTYNSDPNKKDIFTQLVITSLTRLLAPPDNINDNLSRDYFSLQSVVPDLGSFDEDLTADIINYPALITLLQAMSCAFISYFVNGDSNYIYDINEAITIGTALDSIQGEPIFNPYRSGGIIENLQSLSSSTQKLWSFSLDLQGNVTRSSPQDMDINSGLWVGWSANLGSITVDKNLMIGYDTAFVGIDSMDYNGGLISFKDIINFNINPSMPVIGIKYLTLNGIKNIDNDTDSSKPSLLAGTKNWIVGNRYIYENKGNFVGESSKLIDLVTKSGSAIVSMNNIQGAGLSFTCGILKCWGNHGQIGVQSISNEDALCSDFYDAAGIPSSSTFCFKKECASAKWIYVTNNGVQSYSQPNNNCYNPRTQWGLLDNGRWTSDNQPDFLPIGEGKKEGEGKLWKNRITEEGSNDRTVGFYINGQIAHLSWKQALKQMYTQSEEVNIFPNDNKRYLSKSTAFDFSQPYSPVFDNAFQVDASAPPVYDIPDNSNTNKYMYYWGTDPVINHTQTGRYATKKAYAIMIMGGTDRIANLFKGEGPDFSNCLVNNPPPGSVVQNLQYYNGINQSFSSVEKINEISGYPDPNNTSGYTQVKYLTGNEGLIIIPQVLNRSCCANNDSNYFGCNGIGNLVQPSIIALTRIGSIVNQGQGGDMACTGIETLTYNAGTLAIDQVVNSGAGPTISNSPGPIVRGIRNVVQNGYTTIDGEKGKNFLPPFAPSFYTVDGAPVLNLDSSYRSLFDNTTAKRTNPDSLKYATFFYDFSGWYDDGVENIPLSIKYQQGTISINSINNYGPREWGQIGRAGNELKTAEKFIPTNPINGSGYIESFGYTNDEDPTPKENAWSIKLLNTITSIPSNVEDSTQVVTLYNDSNKDFPSEEESKILRDSAGKTIGVGQYGGYTIYNSMFCSTDSDSLGSKDLSTISNILPYPYSINNQMITYVNNYTPHSIIWSYPTKENLDYNTNKLSNDIADFEATKLNLDLYDPNSWNLSDYNKATNLGLLYDANKVPFEGAEQTGGFYFQSTQKLLNILENTGWGINGSNPVSMYYEYQDTLTPGSDLEKKTVTNTIFIPQNWGLLTIGSIYNNVSDAYSYGVEYMLSSLGDVQINTMRSDAPTNAGVTFSLLPRVLVNTPENPTLTLGLLGSNDYIDTPINYFFNELATQINVQRFDPEQGFISKNFDTSKMEAEVSMVHADIGDVYSNPRGIWTTGTDNTYNPKWPFSISLNSNKSLLSSEKQLVEQADPTQAPGTALESNIVDNFNQSLSITDANGNTESIVPYLESSGACYGVYRTIDSGSVTPGLGMMRQFSKPIWVDTHNTLTKMAWTPADSITPDQRFEIVASQLNKNNICMLGNLKNSDLICTETQLGQQFLQELNDLVNDLDNPNNSGETFYQVLKAMDENDSISLPIPLSGIDIFYINWENDIQFPEKSTNLPGWLGANDSIPELLNTPLIFNNTMLNRNIVDNLYNDVRSDTDQSIGPSSRYFPTTGNNFNGTIPFPYLQQPADGENGTSTAFLAPFVNSVYPLSTLQSSNTYPGKITSNWKQTLDIGPITYDSASTVSTMMPIIYWTANAQDILDEKMINLPKYNTPNIFNHLWPKFENQEYLMGKYFGIQSQYTGADQGYNGPLNSVSKVSLNLLSSSYGIPIAQSSIDNENKELEYTNYAGETTLGNEYIGNYQTAKTLRRIKIVVASEGSYQCRISQDLSKLKQRDGNLHLVSPEQQVDPDPLYISEPNLIYYAPVNHTTDNDIDRGSLNGVQNLNSYNLSVDGENTIDGTNIKVAVVSGVNSNSPTSIGEIYGSDDSFYSVPTVNKPYAPVKINIPTASQIATDIDLNSGSGSPASAGQVASGAYDDIPFYDGGSIVDLITNDQNLGYRETVLLDGGYLKPNYNDPSKKFDGRRFNTAISLTYNEIANRDTPDPSNTANDVLAMADHYANKFYQVTNQNGLSFSVPCLMMPNQGVYDETTLGIWHLNGYLELSGGINGPYPVTYSHTNDDDEDGPNSLVLVPYSQGYQLEQLVNQETSSISTLSYADYIANDGMYIGGANFPQKVLGNTNIGDYFTFNGLTGQQPGVEYMLNQQAPPLTLFNGQLFDSSASDANAQAQVTGFKNVYNNKATTDAVGAIISITPDPLYENITWAWTKFSPSTDPNENTPQMLKDFAVSKVVDSEVELYELKSQDYGDLDWFYRNQALTYLQMLDPLQNVINADSHDMFNFEDISDPTDDTIKGEVPSGVVAYQNGVGLVVLLDTYLTTAQIEQFEEYNMLTSPNYVRYYWDTNRKDAITDLILNGVNEVDPNLPSKQFFNELPINPWPAADLVIGSNGPDVLGSINYTNYIGLLEQYHSYGYLAGLGGGGAEGGELFSDMATEGSSILMFTRPYGELKGNQNARYDQGHTYRTSLDGGLTANAPFAMRGFVDYNDAPIRDNSLTDSNSNIIDWYGYYAAYGFHPPSIADDSVRIGENSFYNLNSPAPIIGSGLTIWGKGVPGGNFFITTSMYDDNVNPAPDLSVTIKDISHYYKATADDSTSDGIVYPETFPVQNAADIGGFSVKPTTLYKDLGNFGGVTQLKNLVAWNWTPNNYLSATPGGQAAGQAADPGSAGCNNLNMTALMQQRNPGDLINSQDLINNGGPPTSYSLTSAWIGSNRSTMFSQIGNTEPSPDTPTSDIDFNAMTDTSYTEEQKQFLYGANELWCKMFQFAELRDVATNNPNTKVTNQEANFFGNFEENFDGAEPDWMIFDFTSSHIDQVWSNCFQRKQTSPSQSDSWKNKILQDTVPPAITYEWVLSPGPGGALHGVPLNVDGNSTYGTPNKMIYSDSYDYKQVGSIITELEWSGTQTQGKSDIEIILGNDNAVPSVSDSQSRSIYYNSPDSNVYKAQPYETMTVVTAPADAIFENIPDQISNMKSPDGAGAPGLDGVILKGNHDWPVFIPYADPIILPLSGNGYKKEEVEMETIGKQLDNLGVGVQGDDPNTTSWTSLGNFNNQNEGYVLENFTSSHFSLFSNRYVYPDGNNSTFQFSFIYYNAVNWIIPGSWQWNTNAMSLLDYMQQPADAPYSVINLQGGPPDTNYWLYGGIPVNTVNYLCPYKLMVNIDLNEPAEATIADLMWDQSGLNLSSLRDAYILTNPVNTHKNAKQGISLLNGTIFDNVNLGRARTLDGWIHFGDDTYFKAQLSGVPEIDYVVGYAGYNPQDDWQGIESITPDYNNNGDESLDVTTIPVPNQNPKMLEQRYNMNILYGNRNGVPDPNLGTWNVKQNPFISNEVITERDYPFVATSAMVNWTANDDIAYVKQDLAEYFFVYTLPSDIGAGYDGLYNPGGASSSAAAGGIASDKVLGQAMGPLNNITNNIQPTLAYITDAWWYTGNPGKVDICHTEPTFNSGGQGYRFKDWTAPPPTNRPYPVGSILESSSTLAGSRTFNNYYASQDNYKDILTPQGILGPGFINDELDIKDTLLGINGYPTDIATPTGVHMGAGYFVDIFHNALERMYLNSGIVDKVARTVHYTQPINLASVNKNEFLSRWGNYDSGTNGVDSRWLNPDNALEWTFDDYGTGSNPSKYTEIVNNYEYNNSLSLVITDFTIKDSDNVPENTKLIPVPRDYNNSMLTLNQPKEVDEQMLAIESMVQYPVSSSLPFGFNPQLIQGGILYPYKIADTVTQNDSGKSYPQITTITAANALVNSYNPTNGGTRNNGFSVINEGKSYVELSTQEIASTESQSLITKHFSDISNNKPISWWRDNSDEVNDSELIQIGFNESIPKYLVPAYVGDNTGGSAAKFDTNNTYYGFSFENPNLSSIITTMQYYMIYGPYDKYVKVRNFVSNEVNSISESLSADTTGFSNAYQQAQANYAQEQQKAKTEEENEKSTKLSQIQTAVNTWATYNGQMLAENDQTFNQEAAEKQFQLDVDNTKFQDNIRKSQLNMQNDMDTFDKINATKQTEIQEEDAATQKQEAQVQECTEEEQVNIAQEQEQISAQTQPVIAAAMTTQAALSCIIS